MGDHPHKTRTAVSWRTLLAILCVLLVVVAGVVQVAHTHSDGGVLHADCGLCAAAHITVQVAATPVAAPPTAVVTAVEFVRADVAPPVLSTFALFTRPPPAPTFA